MLLFVWYCCIGLILIRLFYWQVIQSDALQATATTQYQHVNELTAQRGEIKTQDGYTLVSNAIRYRLFAEPPIIQNATAAASSIAPILTEFRQNERTAKQAVLATSSAVSPSRDSSEEIILTESKLKQAMVQDRSWVALDHSIDSETKERIKALDIYGIGFDRYFVRSYPEASIAAHVTGFVGKDAQGNDTGYFGIEGSLNRELSPQNGKLRHWADALGRGLFNTDSSVITPAISGRTVTLTLQRDIQALLQQELRRAMLQYGASAGEIVIMDPKSGAIKGLAATPQYDPHYFYEFETDRYKNPTLTELFEPGSIFKVLTVAAGLDTGVITPESPCNICDGPYKYGSHTIRTWDDTYEANISMRDALARSDNVAMIDIAQRLGSDTFKGYLEAFGIGSALDLELQEDGKTPFPQKWGPVELATRSFGQGVSTNSLQMVRAVSVIANGGTMVRPHVVAAVTDPTTGEVHETQTAVLERVISPEAARDTTAMMVHAASKGEAQWTATDAYTVAGKTGTSQIPDESGGYKEDATIASFIGFAPANDPSFVMLVKLEEPTSSPWAAETAAPLWYDLADKVRLLLQ